MLWNEVTVAITSRIWNIRAWLGLNEAEVLKQISFRFMKCSHDSQEIDTVGHLPFFFL